jgi:hypothetical protein
MKGTRIAVHPRLHVGIGISDFVALVAANAGMYFDITYSEQMSS